MTITIELSPPSISSGTSEESEYINEQTELVAQHQSLPAANQLLSELRFDLMNLKLDCSTDDWDNQGSLPIFSEAYLAADKFLVLLDSNGLPFPEVIPNVDGSLEFEWYASTDKILSIILNGNKLIGFSSFFGTDDKTYGTRRFTDFIPNDIKVLIDKFT